MLNKTSQKQQWSELEKQRLFKLVKTYGNNQRVNWKSIATQFENRTSVQCKLQYRNVLIIDQKVDKRNFEWTDENHLNHTAIRNSFCSIWTFIQQNYFNQLKPQQLQLKYQQIKYQRQQFDQILLENEKRILSAQEIKLLKLGQRRIALVKQKLLDLKEIKPGITMMDPLMIKFLKEIITEKQIAIMETQFQKIDKIFSDQQILKQ
ncbi:Myb-like_DNA-binding domain-containing protein [Hexamita inflata]|uniref:Myb-like DNA-binding domain-containing protein n=1 Tax=Hexamita inflata TaxID=28002 RepID=A0AA86R360_9EUKA|nr:Myb-like DNA-binding domain-containing protein [Hexamita inflata]